MKSYYAFPACLLAAAVLTGCAQPQKNLQRDPTSAIAVVQLSSNVQSARPDAFAAPLEVVRYDRYLLVSTSPSQAQRAPLEQVIDIRIPASLTPTVADAMRYALRQSGFNLCSITSANRVLYNQALPAVHHQLGPIRLSEALQILAGPAWQLDVDSVQRVVCHSLREGFRLPPEPTPAPIANSHFLQPPAIKSVAPAVQSKLQPTPAPARQRMLK
ncbi:PilL N-terminal domain-containing protein [Yersinia ruckeri]|uniref:PFGI-1 class ICE element type IV pilus protein PilL2 n=1 Tax=Yersinia ruckeri TaxID=29486 RepID=UPI001F1F2030|nr:PilL N-terminal domain-containing protein [Yersinia ruckeri]MCW6527989.1 PilL N-terminal domain-containing protein [Yersinia ruckeri]MCW6563161.1 PilL N-terminal domain-containing protein [Yersinia ruckeri]UIM97020.1 PilL N-terminal domain-containing protein [Yersinia ruckeri]UZY05101.1 PilL N-terminal domain-containing protein [Yersinia ruckeri]